MRWGSRFLACIIGLAATSAAAAAAQVAASADSLRLRVDGMVCSLCAFGVERRLEKLGQVDHVNVMLDSALVVVLLKPGAAVSDSVLAAEVRKAGFALRGVERIAREKKPGA